MKNFGFFSLIFLLPILSQADTMDQAYGQIARAWAAQTGVEIELTNSGNNLYKEYVEEKYRTPLAVSAQIAHAIHIGRIEINVKWDFP